MNLPDKLTISRIFLTFILMFFLFSAGLAAKVSALIVFLIASLTDFLDGKIAKEQNISTDFGKLMDPIADKILVLGTFLAFVEMKLIPAWMVVIVIMRDVMVTGLRILALGKKRVIVAEKGGKHKMVSQVIVILVILLFLIFREAGMGTFNFWNQRTEAIYTHTIFILMLVTVVLTLISGVSYLIKNKEIYISGKHH